MNGSDKMFDVFKIKKTQNTWKKYISTNKIPGYTKSNASL